MAATSSSSESAGPVILSPHRVECDVSRPVSIGTKLSSSLTSHESIKAAVQMSTTRRGKVLPIESFAGEGVDMLFEEWLPSFERTAT